MAKKIKSRETFKFKKGEKTHLDIIYNIQGLDKGDWWDRKDENYLNDNIIITRDVHFEIIVYN
jgi:hypothetical protein